MHPGEEPAAGGPPPIGMGCRGLRRRLAHGGDADEPAVGPDLHGERARLAAEGPSTHHERRRADEPSRCRLRDARGDERDAVRLDADLLEAKDGHATSVYAPWEAYSSSSPRVATYTAINAAAVATAAPGLTNPP